MLPACCSICKVKSPRCSPVYMLSALLYMLEKKRKGGILFCLKGRWKRKWASLPETEEMMLKTKNKTAFIQFINESMCLFIQLKYFINIYASSLYDLTFTIAVCRCQYYCVLEAHTGGLHDSEAFWTHSNNTFSYIYNRHVATPCLALIMNISDRWMSTLDAKFST